MIQISDKTIQISADGVEATFQLYDTQAAEDINQKELKELFGEDGISAVLSIRN